MSFTDLAFPPFLLLVLLLFRLLPGKARPALLLAASWTFYACHDLRLLGLLIGVTFVSWFCALRGTRGWRNAGIAVCLGALGIFKYTQFFADCLFALPRLFGVPSAAPQFGIILPMGISFYVFQAVSSLIDTGRGRVRAERNSGYYALYLSFFPQLVAGPIERMQDLLPQLRDLAGPAAGDREEGLRLILRGYAKKLLIADTLAPLVNAAYADPASAGGAAMLAATAFFALQIYGDFAGYSDIAIGIGRLLGIRLSENFRRPYGAGSLRDFWRRWHITLTRWLTDYLYIPLGGSKKGLARQCLNTVLVFLVSGLWHGAGLSYAAWGLVHGIGLSAERLTERVRIPAQLRRLLTLAFVLLAWVLFRAGSLTDALLIYRTIFTDFRPENLLAGLGADLAGLGCAVLCALMLPAVERLPVLRWKEKGGTAWLLWLLLILAVVLARCAALTTGGDTAFIYFQF